MTNEQDARQLVIDKGSKVILWLLQGPEAWEKTPRAAIRPEAIGTSLLIGAAAPHSMHTKWIDTQRTLGQTMVTLLIQDLAEWAVLHDRLDLFLTVGELVEEAVLASENP